MAPRKSVFFIVCLSAPERFQVNIKTRARFVALPSHLLKLRVIACDSSNQSAFSLKWIGDN
jgi:hypothetical protein